MPTNENILGVKIDVGYTLDSAVAEIRKLLVDKTNSSSHLIATTNPEFIVKAKHDKTFLEVLNTSYLSLPDGIGIVQALHYKKIRQRLRSHVSFVDYLFKTLSLIIAIILSAIKSSPARIAGVDLVDKICQVSQKESYSIFLLGASPEVSRAAVSELQAKYPGLCIIGNTGAYTADTSDDASTLSFIHECMRKQGIEHLDMLFVAYTFGEQEKWLARNMKLIPVKVGIGVGGTFDYVSKKYKRAPVIIQSLGFEWLYRFVTQPHRIKRIFNAVVVFYSLLTKSY